MRSNFHAMCATLAALRAAGALPPGGGEGGGGGGAGFVDGVLLDLGVSSMQLDRPERGFSFMHDGPLDMRMDPSSPLTAAEVVNTYPEAELARILVDYGEYTPPQARGLARRICSVRAGAGGEGGWIGSTAELVRLLRLRREDVPMRLRRRGGAGKAGGAGAGAGGRHPATKLFQSLRIAVNGELQSLERALGDDRVYDMMAVGGRLAVITFHSLEDRIVKRAFRARAAAPGGGGGGAGGARFRVVTRKPIVPDEAEMASNPRSRSAKLRVLERVG